MSSSAAGWLGHRLERRGTVTSTNDEAAALARAGAPHGTVVVADAQTRGRGRQGHDWFSPAGENLYLSAVLRLPLAPPRVPPLTLAAGVGVCDALRETGVAGASLKWPNDLIVEPRPGDGGPGRKLAGILTEMSSRGDKVEFVILGVGVNVNTASFPPELQAIATSIRQEAGGAPQDREAFLLRLLGHLERRVDAFVSLGTADCVRAWKERTRFLGRRVEVTSDGQVLRGHARDVDDEGALWLESDEGRRYRIISGEVTSHLPERPA